MLCSFRKAYIFFKKISDKVRASFGKEHPVTLMFEDQHSNDFNALFARLQGRKTGNSSLKLKRWSIIMSCAELKLEKVYTLASATSFFKQCFQNNSIDVAMSFMSFHFLSEK